MTDAPRDATRAGSRTRTRHGRQVIVPERAEGVPPEDLLDADGREWTTFALRVETDVVGVWAWRPPAALGGSGVSCS